MDKIVQIAKALADKHTIAGWELLDPDKKRAFEQEAESYAEMFKEEITAARRERDALAEDADGMADNVANLQTELASITSRYEAAIDGLKDELSELRISVSGKLAAANEEGLGLRDEKGELQGKNAKANYLKEQAEQERDTLKATLGRQEDRFWAQVTDDNLMIGNLNKVIAELKSEVKAGAGMLADMHDKYQTVSQAVGIEWERFANFLLDHYKGALEREDKNSIAIYAMILNFSNKYNLPALKNKADKIRGELNERI